jgi:hypothetical protein
MSILYKVQNGVKVEMQSEETTEFLAALPTTEELTTRKLEVLREVRNTKLAETDWWMMPDLTATDAQITYRQALRDITNTYSSLDDVVWPEKPE